MPAHSVPTTSFASLGLAPPLVATLAALGYEEATPVQGEAIPLMLSGKDLLAQAATGTGKTAAFALPMIHRLLEEEGGRRHTRGLVLVPTRELAMQVSEAIHKYARGTGIQVVPLYGGASMEQQIRSLRRGADIAVATPGRALDHLRRKTLKLDKLSVLVLDEADEMLDMGFVDDIEVILSSAPDTRQAALFTATMPARIMSIVKRHLSKPARVTIAGEKTAAGKLPRIRQVAYVVRRDQKPAALDRILDMENPTSALVFCRTRLQVDSLTETLNAHGYRAEALHGANRSDVTESGIEDELDDGKPPGIGFLEDDSYRRDALEGEEEEDNQADYAGRCKYRLAGIGKGCGPDGFAKACQLGRFVATVNMEYDGHRAHEDLTGCERRDQSHPNAPVHTHRSEDRLDHPSQLSRERCIHLRQYNEWRVLPNSNIRLHTPHPKI